jgi:hypothetical protein
VGYVISGRATLELEGQTLSLKAGDSWLVPAGAMHQYKILDHFTAIEATSPQPRSTVATSLSDFAVGDGTTPFEKSPCFWRLRPVLFRQSDEEPDKLRMVGCQRR